MANLILPPGLHESRTAEEGAELALRRGVELKQIAHRLCEGDPNVAMAALIRAASMVAFEARLPVKPWQKQLELFHIAEQSRT